MRRLARNAMTVLRAHGPGAALDVCSQIQNLICTPSFAAKKGEARALQVAVRNDGSQSEDVTARLVITLDGVDRSSAIVGRNEVALPELESGEPRVAKWTIHPTAPGIYKVDALFTSAPTES